jgi:CheY-like chemotaxis protein
MKPDELTIILLDDNLAIREGLKDSLYREGKKLGVTIKFYSADNGVEGLGYIFILKPDLVIVDSTLPKYGGREVLEYIFTNGRLQSLSTPIIVLDQSQGTEISKEPTELVTYLVKSDKNFLSKINDLLVKYISRSLSYDHRNANATGTSASKTNVLGRGRRYLQQALIRVANSCDVLANRYYDSGIVKSF